MKLSEHQIDFILDMFFKSYETQYNGAMNIGRGLLTTGTATVAGNEPIFKGGIGNFIETSKAEGLYHCLEYKIDLESFISSHFFREALNATVEDLKRESALLIERTKNLEILYLNGNE
jgi:hypothetical protein